MPMMARMVIVRFMLRPLLKVPIHPSTWYLVLGGYHPKQQRVLPTDSRISYSLTQTQDALVEESVVPLPTWLGA